MHIIKHTKRTIGSNRSGTAATEFALVMLPFIIMFVGIFDLGAYISQTIVLQNAVASSARMIETGQISSGNKAAFLANIQANTYGLVDTTAISVNVSAYNSFSAAPSPLPPLFNNVNLPINQNFNTGTANQAVVVMVGCIHTFFTPLVGNLLSATGASIFTSVKVFRNENF